MIFAIAYLTYVTTQTPGPFACFDWVRERFAKDSALGMFWCAWCMAGWVSIALHLLNPNTLNIIEVLGDGFLGAVIAWGISILQSLAGQCAKFLEVRS